MISGGPNERKTAKLFLVSQGVPHVHASPPTTQLSLPLGWLEYEHDYVDWEQVIWIKTYMMEEWIVYGNTCCEARFENSWGDAIIPNDKCFHSHKDTGIKDTVIIGWEDDAWHYICSDNNFRELTARITNLRFAESRKKNEQQGCDAIVEGMK